MILYKYCVRITFFCGRGGRVVASWSEVSKWYVWDCRKRRSIYVSLTCK